MAYEKTTDDFGKSLAENGAKLLLFEQQLIGAAREMEKLKDRMS